MWPFRAYDAPKVIPSSKAKPTFKDLKSFNPTNIFIPLDPPISSSSNNKRKGRKYVSQRSHSRSTLSMQ